MLPLLQNSGAELKDSLKLKSFPLGIKLLASKSSIPDGAKRPTKDFGYHLSLCQAFTTSRRQGTAIAMLKEDMWCFYPVIGYGMEKPVDFFLKGNTRFPDTVSSPEAGESWAQTFPYLKEKRAGLVFAPLQSLNFIPDIVLFYCDSIQMYAIVKALTWKSGVDLSIKLRLCSVASCVYAGVQPLLTSDYTITFPDGGDRQRAITHDDEIIFSLKTDRLAELMEGVKHAKLERVLYKTSPFTAIPEYELNVGNKTVRSLLGMSG